MSSQQGQRELVFCHACENEWYRDQHGLECPDCHSDAVEIIEEDHDPRREMHEENFLTQHGQDFFGSGFGGFNAPTPQEGDVERVEYDTPDGHHISRTIRISNNGGNVGGGRMVGQVGAGGGGGGGDAMVAGLFNRLLSSIGGMTPQEVFQNQQQRQQETPGEQGHAGNPPPIPPRPFSSSSSPPSPTSGTYMRAPPPPPSGPPAMPRQQFTRRQYQIGPFNLNVMTSSRTFVNGQPVSPANDPDFEGMFTNMFSPIASQMRPAPGGRGFVFTTGPSTASGPDNPEGPGAAGIGGPLGMLLASMGLLGGGRMGDAVFTEEAMDRLMTQFMEQNQTSTAPGPASDEAISSLPKKVVDKDMLDPATGKADCSICMDECELGSEVTELPCKHWFHFDCVKSWLQEHDTCPQCRRGITPKEGDGSRSRETGEAPRHWQAPSLSRQNTHEEVSPASPTASARRVPSSHTYGRTEPGPNDSGLGASRWRSRSPIRTNNDGAGNAGGGGGGSGSGMSALRNGILGWMGRRSNSSSTVPTGGSAQQPVGPSASGSGNGTGNQPTQRDSAGRGPPSHPDLDMPDVD